MGAWFEFLCTEKNKRSGIFSSLFLSRSCHHHIFLSPTSRLRCCFPFPFTVCALSSIDVIIWTSQIVWQVSRAFCCWDLFATSTTQTHKRADTEQQEHSGAVWCVVNRSVTSDRWVELSLAHPCENKHIWIVWQLLKLHKLGDRTLFTVKKKKKEEREEAGLMDVSVVGQTVIKHLKVTSG